jgi:hypothetical protein
LVRSLLILWVLGSLCGIGEPNNQRTEEQSTLSLLDFAMHLMLPAERAEFLHFQPVGHCFLILGLAVILSLTFGALKCDDFAHV